MSFKDIFFNKVPIIEPDEWVDDALKTNIAWIMSDKDHILKSREFVINLGQEELLRWYKEGYRAGIQDYKNKLRQDDKS